MWLKTLFMRLEYRELQSYRIQVIKRILLSEAWLSEIYIYCERWNDNPHEMRRKIFVMFSLRSAISSVEWCGVYFVCLVGWCLTVRLNRSLCQYCENWAGLSSSCNQNIVFDDSISLTNDLRGFSLASAWSNLIHLNTSNISLHIVKMFLVLFLIANTLKSFHG